MVNDTDLKKEARKKVFNWSKVRLYRSNLVQNPYFKSAHQLNLFKLGKDGFGKIAKISNLQKHTFHQKKVATPTPWLRQIRFSQISITRLFISHLKYTYYTIKFALKGIQGQAVDRKFG